MFTLVGHLIGNFQWKTAIPLKIAAILMGLILAMAAIVVFDAVFTRMSMSHVWKPRRISTNNNSRLKTNVIGEEFEAE